MVSFNEELKVIHHLDIHVSTPNRVSFNEELKDTGACGE